MQVLTPSQQAHNLPMQDKVWSVQYANVVSSVAEFSFQLILARD